ncbi:MAG: hypothetical protein WCO23_04000 [bacterium]
MKKLQYIKNQYDELKHELQIGQYLTYQNLDYAILIVALIVGVYLRWKLEDIAFVLFLIWHFLHPLTSQTLAKVALFFLSLTPIFLIIKRDASAEQFAVYAYYFLVLTVIMAIIEMKREEKSDQGN